MTPEETKEASDSLSKYSKINSDRGVIYFVPIKNKAQGSDIFAEIAGKQEYVDFQAKDAADNILYAWEFSGAELTSTADINLNLAISSIPFEGCAFGDKTSAVYLSFAENGPLPGPASLYVKTESFENGEIFHLYSWSEDGTLTDMEQEAELVNGYLSLNVNYRENLILSLKELKAEATVTPAPTLSPAAVSETPQVKETTADDTDDAETETAGQSASEEIMKEAAGEKSGLDPVIPITIAAAAAAAVLIGFGVKKKK